MSNTHKLKPTVVGMAALDAIRFKDHVKLCIGGVSTNIACVLGQLGHTPRFVSPSPEETLSHSLKKYLEEHSANWVPLPLNVAMPFFEAYIDDEGQVTQEQFIDNQVYQLMDADFIKAHEDLILEDTNLLISTTDMHVESLNALANIAKKNDIPFFLVSSNLPKTQRIPPLDPKPNFLAINQGELNSISPKPLKNEAEVAQFTQSLVAEDGVCLVTFGARGALLIRHKHKEVIYQGVPQINCPSTVCAGDTLFASLVTHFFESRDWQVALAKATHITLSFLANRTHNEAFTFKIDHSLELPEAEISQF